MAEDRRRAQRADRRAADHAGEREGHLGSRMNDADIRRSGKWKMVLTDDQLEVVSRAERWSGGASSPPAASPGSPASSRSRNIIGHPQRHPPRTRDRAGPPLMGIDGPRRDGTISRREAGPILTANDMINQHNLDRAIWNLDLDFYHKTASVAKRATRWRGQPGDALILDRIIQGDVLDTPEGHPDGPLFRRSLPPRPIGASGTMVIAGQLGNSRKTRGE